MWPLTGTARENGCRSTQGPSSFWLIFQSLVHPYLRPCFQHLPSHFSHRSSYCWVFLGKPVVAQPLKRFPLFYGIRQVHYHVHKSPPLAPIRSQMNPVHTHILFLWFLFNIIFPFTSRFSLWSLLSTHLCLFHLAVLVQQFTKLKPLYAPEDSLRCSQEHATGPYPDPVETSPHKYIVCLRSILILSPRIGLSFLSGVFTPWFLTKILCALLIRVSRSQIA
jgi:hypothetical protein